MAMSCAYTATRQHGMLVATFTWTSASDGSFSGSSPAVYGILRRVVTNPGSVAPSDDYDLVCTDADGIDVFAGKGANRDTANTENFCPGLPCTDGTTTTSITPFVVGSVLTLTGSNAGDSKIGTTVLYIEQLDA